jgi:hypothetical protein
MIKYEFLANKNTKLCIKKHFLNLHSVLFTLLFIIYYIIGVTLYYYGFFNLIKFVTGSVITK